MVTRLVMACLFSIMALVWPVSIRAQCILCDKAATNIRGTEQATAQGTGLSAPERPLSIEVTADLDFSRLTANGDDGAILVDPVNSERSLQGDVVDLGGYALKGEVVISGTPGRGVRIHLPAEIELNASSGATARVSPIVTDLPPMPRLDISGRLIFHFGGKLHITRGLDGNFRGRIPITADYE